MGALVAFNPAGLQNIISKGFLKKSEKHYEAPSPDHIHMVKNMGKKKLLVLHYAFRIHKLKIHH